ncbi:hypothetical protein C8R44DRAFT_741849 [Mycena epipterygia]|nr:hypothetical protein C8R44DRAFT_741849 [Mycena epipterygia]
MPICGVRYSRRGGVCVEDACPRTAWVQLVLQAPSYSIVCQIARGLCGGVRTELSDAWVDVVAGLVRAARVGVGFRGRVDAGQSYLRERTSAVCSRAEGLACGDALVEPLMPKGCMCMRPMSMPIVNGVRRSAACERRSAQIDAGSAQQSCRPRVQQVVCSLIWWRRRASTGARLRGEDGRVSGLSASRMYLGWARVRVEGLRTPALRYGESHHAGERLAAVSSWAGV